MLVTTAILGTTAFAGETADELKANAYDAARVAEEARELVAAATERLKVAEETAAAAVAAVEVAGRAQGGSVLPQAKLEEVRREAELAHQKADQALAAIAEIRKRVAWSRSGAYFGGALFWAPELFDTNIGVSSSRGYAGWLGYRFGPWLAVEARIDRFDDFDFRSSSSVGSLKAWELTGNLKFFLSVSRFQPYLMIGAGSFSSRLQFESVESGRKFSDKDRNFVIRSGIGIETYLTPSLALGLEGSFSSVSGALDFVRFGQLAAGLIFRF